MSALPATPLQRHDAHVPAFKTARDVPSTPAGTVMNEYVVTVARQDTRSGTSWRCSASCSSGPFEYAHGLHQAAADFCNLPELGHRLRGPAFSP